jgi:hypothetical protein
VHQNIPSELKQLNQWVVSNENKIPIDPKTGKAASVTDPATWASFDIASKANYKHVGFVLSSTDPYAIIDLDNKPDKPLTAEKVELHQRIIKEFGSYTELSASGHGHHIIIKGAMPAGVHNSELGIEAYSSSRYMICTGRSIDSSLKIIDCQEGLDWLLDFARIEKITPAELLDRPSPMSDEDLIDMAMRAENGEKFDLLCQGKWEELGYPSQSEADYALLSILTFYTPNNDQVRRLFRYSLLGRREKAQKNNVYLDRCLGKIRKVQSPGMPIDFGQIIKVAEQLTEKPKDHNPPSIQGGKDPGDSEETSNAQIPPPPGLVGELARYFHDTAIRPVPEVALCASIAAMAGVAGRCYNISNTGLNQYLLILAKTGIGKEAAASGIGKLWSEVRKTVPSIDDFMGPSTFASGQALVKTIAEQPSFVSVLGEFGLTLQALCDPSANSAQVMLKKVLLDLYNKSGWTEFLGSMKYSDKEKNVKIIHAPCVTILGESNPDSFFANLDLSHIAEGLIPRFSIIEVHSKRPPLNEGHGFAPPSSIVKPFAELAYRALASQQNETSTAFVPTIAIENDARALLLAFNSEADDLINGEDTTNMEVELWNRAYQKALKLSGLIAVGCNLDAPSVNLSHAQWAMDFVRRDISVVAHRFKKGDVGHGDSKRIFDLKRVIEAYYQYPADKLVGYGVDELLWKNKVIPFSYLQRRTANLSSFKNDRLGASAAVHRAITDLIDSGHLQLITPAVAAGKYKTGGKLYALVKQWDRVTAQSGFKE